MKYSFCFCRECVARFRLHKFSVCLTCCLSVCTPRTNHLHEQKDAVQEAVQQHSALPTSQSAENI